MLNFIDEKYFKLIHPDALAKGSGLNVRCPICGDSKKSEKKARLWLYSKNDITAIKCFNCDYHSSLKRYIKDYHPQYLLDYIRETNIYKAPVSVSNEPTQAENVLQSIFKKVDERKQQEQKEVEHKYFLGMQALTQQHHEYLVSRCVPTSFLSVFVSSLGFVETPERTYNLENFIIYPIFNKTEVYPISFYSRSVSQKQFYHYTKTGFNKYYELIRNPKNKDIWVFEGLFDALTSGVDNFVVLFGASFPFKPAIHQSNYIWCFDNDETGLEKLKQKAEQGERVCLIKDFTRLKDINDIVIQNKYTTDEMRDLLYNHVYSGYVARMRVRMR